MIIFTCSMRGHLSLSKMKEIQEQRSETNFRNTWSVPFLDVFLDVYKGNKRHKPYRDLERHAKRYFKRHRSVLTNIPNIILGQLFLC